MSAAVRTDDVDARLDRQVCRGSWTVVTCRLRALAQGAGVVTRYSECFGLVVRTCVCAYVRKVTVIQCQAALLLCILWYSVTTGGTSRLHATDPIVAHAHVQHAHPPAAVHPPSGDVVVRSGSHRGCRALQLPPRSTPSSTECRTWYGHRLGSPLHRGLALQSRGHHRRRDHRFRCFAIELRRHWQLRPSCWLGGSGA